MHVGWVKSEEFNFEAVLKLSNLDSNTYSTMKCLEKLSNGSYLIVSNGNLNYSNYFN
jgi:hypothetical protein